MTAAEQVSHHAAWVEKLMDEHWQGWMATFMFKELHAGESGTIAIMSQDVQAFYRKLLTRIARKPNSFHGRATQPVLIGCPDFPVFKREKRAGKLSLTNGGLHFGALILLPYQAYTNSTRLKQPLDEHIKQRSLTYCGPSSRIDRIDIKIIDYKPARACAYVLKSIENDRLSTSELIILPRSIIEL